MHQSLKMLALKKSADQVLDEVDGERWNDGVEVLEVGLLLAVELLPEDAHQELEHG